MGRGLMCIFGLLGGVLLAAEARAQSNLAFPHVVVGDPFETVLQVVNEVGVSIDVVIDVFQGGSAGAANGTPLAVQFDGSTPVSSRTVTLTAYQELSNVLRSGDSTVRNGWLRVRSTTPGSKISGNLIFRQRSGAVIVDSVAVASPQRLRYAIIQIDNREAGSNTGVAFANPDSSAVAVTLDLYRADQLVATSAVTLQPNQHFARFVTEIFSGFGAQQGTLVLETQAGKSLPFLTLRADGTQFTGIPVRPLGFVFQFEVRNSSNTVIETGVWLFDFLDFDLLGLGRRDSDPAGTFFGVRGTWLARNFQFSYRTQFPDGTFGMVVFNGTSAGAESTRDSNGSSQLIVGKVTTVDANGLVVSTNNFTAGHKF